jgi:hypothetical protein
MNTVRILVADDHPRLCDVQGEAGVENGRLRMRDGYMAFVMIMGPIELHKE